MTSRRICLLTIGPLCSDPRIVKEADALYEAGYSVRVVAFDAVGPIRELNASILARAPWRVDKVTLGPRPIHLMRRLRQEISKAGIRFAGSNNGIAIGALSPLTHCVAKLAAAEPADLYIGHNLPTLPAVAWAARRHGAKLGFDAEDDHVAELEDTMENRREIAIRRQIEKEFLPQCHHLTAAAPGIADAYYQRYGVTMTSILNVFPRSLAPAANPVCRLKEESRPLSVYWFSQTIGPGRGLEQVIKAMGSIRERLTLSVRGSDFLGYSSHLKRLAAQVGAGDSIHFLDSAPPDELVRLAAEHDVGLATELDTPPNRAICLSNKIFTYLLAGIPVLLSNTPAQRKLTRELGSAAQIIDLNNPTGIARALETWAANSQALLAAKNEAWELGQKRFNWDIEKTRFLERVNKAFDLQLWTPTK